MRKCPKCNSAYSDNSLNFCLADGSPLYDDRDLEATVVMPPPAQPSPTINDLPSPIKEQQRVFVNCPYCGEITEIVCPLLRDDIELESVEAVPADANPAGSYNHWSEAVCAKCGKRMRLFWCFNYYSDDDEDSHPSNDEEARERSLYSLKEENEIVVVEFPTANGRVLKGPYPYRFALDMPQSCALLIAATIWASRYVYENVVDVFIDDRKVTEIRQGYEKLRCTRIEIGDLSKGRHTISFTAHYEDSDGKHLEDADAQLNPAKSYWILNNLVVVGRAYV